MSVSVTHLFRISVRTKHMQAPPPWRNLWQRGLHMSDWIGSNVSLLSRCPVPRQTKAPAERNIPSHRGFVRPLGLIFFISSVNRSSLSSVLFRIWTVLPDPAYHEKMQTSRQKKGAGTFRMSPNHHGRHRCQIKNSYVRDSPSESESVEDTRLSSVRPRNRSPFLCVM